MDKKTVKLLLIAGYKGAQLGLSQEELIELVESSFPYLISHSVQTNPGMIH